MARESQSRPARWMRACQAGAAAAADRDPVRARAALADLEELQVEYREWRDVLPEDFDAGLLVEKLDAIADLDTDDAEVADAEESEAGDEAEDAWEVVADKFDELSNADFPLGFGRD